ncbi:hypothetical protein [Flavobacterium phage FpV4]|uniref:Uncharacterized protein n=2 Tax=Fipvunavirus Fpv4 TaxID=2560476 RepID=A0A1B0WM78_9CAUD|nr:hypothetical protein BOW80_gp72 [Flavobacterium phage Fpv3]YP_009594125.1 hypothetical protein FDG89_gp69 [Flavobacterium phage FpV4]ALN97182.1 hypothetical protein [Flavobacterium phage FpV4]ANB40474.1 hypothetical protein [Flavobacterium phage Fpv3]
MTFKDVYKFPLTNDMFGGKILTTDNNMAFDFMEKWLDKNSFKVSEEDENTILKILNDTEGIFKTKTKFDYEYKNCVINIIINNVSKPFIMIRGWGHLTGTGGLKLDEKTARKLQDEFAMFIIEKLSA